MKILWVLLLYYAVFSKLTLHQAQTLDITELDCSLIEEISLSINDIEDWIQVIQDKDKLQEDIEGLIGIQNIVKESKQALHKVVNNKQMFIQMSDRMQSTIDSLKQKKSFDNNILTILRLMEEMQQTHDFKRKSEILNEIEVCCNAALSKFQNLQKQSNNVHSTKDLQIKLKQLIVFEEQCYVPDEKAHPKNTERQNNRHETQSREQHHTKRKRNEKFIKKKDFIHQDQNEQIVLDKYDEYQDEIYVNPDPDEQDYQDEQYIYNDDVQQADVQSKELENNNSEEQVQIENNELSEQAQLEDNEGQELQNDDEEIEQQIGQDFQQEQEVVVEQEQEQQQEQESGVEQEKDQEVEQEQQQQQEINRNDQIDDTTDVVIKNDDQISKQQQSDQNAEQVSDEYSSWDRSYKDIDDFVSEDNYGVDEINLTAEEDIQENQPQIIEQQPKEEKTIQEQQQQQQQQEPQSKLVNENESDSENVDHNLNQWKTTQKRSFKLVADPEQLIDPSKFVPFKYKKQPQVDNVVVKQSKFYDSELESKSCFDEQYENVELQDADEYGYGYWIKYSHTKVMNKGQYYFLSRLTTNRNFMDFENYGDRTLSNWIYDTAFVFATYDYGARNKNKFEQINQNEDITNRWYFISFSYSSRKQIGVGIVLTYGAGKSNQKLEFTATHAPPLFMRMIVGGKHLHYAGFQGQFANIFCDVDAPALIETDEQLMQLIEKISFAPSALESYTEIQIIGEAQQFDGNQNTNINKDISEQLIFQEYSVSVWFRWIDNLAVSETNSFQIFNLRSNQKKIDQLGDRTLELHYIYGGGVQNTAINFHTYTVEGNVAKGQASIVKSVKYQQNIWTYAYFGYQAKSKEAYALLLKPGFNQELSFENIEHQQISQLFFTLGGDDQVASFNGKLAYVGVYLGPQSFIKQKNLEYRFLYGEGASQLYQLQQPIIFRGEQVTYDSAYDQEEPIINQFLIQDDTKIKINGQSEYSFGLWTCWLTSYPKYLQKRDSLHHIARLGSQSKALQLTGSKVQSVEQGQSNVKEVTLQARVGTSDYEFSSYNWVDNSIKKCMIPFEDKLEGWWNYIYFGYKKINTELGMAKAYVQFNVDGDIKECSFEVLHSYLVDFVEFFIGKSTVPLFNGKLANIQMRVGLEAFLLGQEQFKSYQKIEKPPIILQIPKKIRETVDLVTAEVNVPQLSDNANVFQLNQNGGVEYSISGWGKWYGARQQGGISNVLLMIQKKLIDIKQGSYDTSLGVQRTDKEFLFSSYTCEAGGDCSQIKENKIEFTEYWDQWTFFYIGYSEKLKKIFGYCKFTFLEQNIELQPISRIYLSSISILLGKKYGISSTFTGLMKSWSLNVGEGSFKEGNYGENEQLKFHFGFDSGSEHLKQESKEIDFSQKLIDSSSNSQSIPWQTEMKDLNGISSYGYGYWSRFRLNTPNYFLSTLPQWVAMSRLTNNKDFQDQSKAGDRILTVMLGEENYQFTTYSGNQPIIAGNTPFTMKWESEWVYIYFSYKRITQTSGQAIGYVAKGQTIQEVKIDAIHYPLSDYLLLLIGHSGQNYPNFNGQFKGIKLILGDSAFIQSKEHIQMRIKNTELEPLLKYDVFHKYTVIDGRLEHIEAINHNPSFIDFPTDQYSVAMWYKHPLIINNNKEIIFRLTSNKQPTDTLIGDRTMALVKETPSITEFSTYSLQPFNPKVPFPCQIPDLSLHTWTFIYMAYSKPQLKLFYYLKADEFECKAEIDALHLISDSLWMYAGSDSIFQRFEGSLAQTALTIGPNSYNINRITYLPEYLVAENLFPKTKTTTWEKNQLVYLAADGDSLSSTLKIEFFNGFQYPIEQLTEYSFGLWTRHLAAFPVRQYQKPAIMHLARLSLNKETSEGVVKIGDRVLATHVVFQYYQVSTYDVNTKASVQQKFIKHDILEGVWRYIYMGYKKEEQKVQSYVYDGELYPMTMDKIMHKPLGDYLTFIVGKDDHIQALQGMFAKIKVLIGNGAYIMNEEAFKTQMQSSLQLPFSLSQKFQDKQKSGKLEIIGGKVQIDAVGGIVSEGDKWSGISEYSIAGWFKSALTGLLEESVCQSLFRLHNNPPNQLNDRKSQGDRTFYSNVCGGHMMKFSTYTLMGLKDPNEANFIDQQFDLVDYKLTWNFFYMGYNQHTKEIHILIKTLKEDKIIVLEQILHIVPNYLGLNVGVDKFASPFKGEMQKWTMMYGFGAFISLKKEGYADMFIFYNEVKPNNIFNWVSQRDTIISTPDTIVQEFLEEIDSTTEYAFGMWTRWLSDFPDDLIIRHESYSIFRLTSNREHTDKSKFGDRVLSAFLGRKEFDFSTYDITTNNFGLSAQTQYEQLEGNWNYIYMGFKNNEVVGVVVTRDTSKATRTTFIARHFPLNGYAKLLINVAEYGHQQFHGWFFDPRLFLGAGSFISDGQSIVTMLQKIHRKIPSPLVDLSDFKWDKNNVMDTSQLEQNDREYLQYTFNDKQESIEYSYCMWVQQAPYLPGMVDREQLIARLTTNHPDSLKDNTYAGDRTLVTTIHNDKLLFYTYFLQDPPSFEQGNGELQIQPLQWTYVYFGYRRAESLAYMLQVKQTQKKTIKANHIIPNIFYLYLVKDQAFPQFYGKISDVKMYFGSSSYFEDPKVTIDRWPFDKKYLENNVVLAQNKKNDQQQQQY